MQLRGKTLEPDCPAHIRAPPSPSCGVSLSVSTPYSDQWGAIMELFLRLL